VAKSSANVASVVIQRHANSPHRPLAAHSHQSSARNAHEETNAGLPNEVHVH